MGRAASSRARGVETQVVSLVSVSLNDYAKRIYASFSKRKTGRVDEVVQEMFTEDDLDLIPREEILEAVQSNLGGRVQRLLQDTRRLPAAERKTHRNSRDIMPDVIGETKRRVELLLAPYMGADGEEKPLIEFTAEDALWQLNTCKSHARTWNGKVKLFREIHHQTKTHGVKTGDLPKNIQSELEELARAI